MVRTSAQKSRGIDGSTLTVEKVHSIFRMSVFGSWSSPENSLTFAACTNERERVLSETLPRIQSARSSGTHAKVSRHC